jgi:hypothetical protein
VAEKQLLATVTGEFFQPVRLHYKVFDQRGLLKAFQKLRCLGFDQTQQRWVWLYDHEAKKLRFQQSYAQIPKHLLPLGIGSVFLRGDDLLLDLRSCERAKLAIPFFDRHIPRKVAKVTDAEVVNKLFSAEHLKVTPTEIFDQMKSTVRDPDAEVQRLAELTAGVQGPEEKLRVAFEDMRARARQPLPEVERFPTNFYEDGIEAFGTTLQMRQMVAMQHWLGNTEYSPFDVIQLMTKSM